MIDQTPHTPDMPNLSRCRLGSIEVVPPPEGANAAARYNPRDHILTLAAGAEWRIHLDPPVGTGLADDDGAVNLVLLTLMRSLSDDGVAMLPVPAHEVAEDILRALEGYLTEERGDS